jgi:hypothetical protein
MVILMPDPPIVDHLSAILMMAVKGCQKREHI